jgi:hypothetical protein
LLLFCVLPVLPQLLLLLFGLIIVAIIMR